MTQPESDIIDIGLKQQILIKEIQSAIENIEKNPFLYQEKNFDDRTETIDFIEFEIIDRIEGLVLKTDQPDELLLLKQRAEKIKFKLAEINTNLFQKLRKKIIGLEGYRGKAFKELICDYTSAYSNQNDIQAGPGYDNLDVLINGLLTFGDMPEETREPEPEMVYYQKTPARVVLDLVERAEFAKEDVFFDLGSGLGQVLILVNILSGVKAMGVEFEPAYCNYARACAKELNLSDVTFENEDARNADYSEGTVFFLYTPFKGSMLQDVLEMLRKESLKRRIKIFTYGPCTAEVALQSWLDVKDPVDNPYKLGVFCSL